MHVRVYILLVFVCACKPVLAQNNLYKEKFRPRFHFSPAKNWANDPNGLVYYDSEYHLFYQYNPFGLRQGHLSWGHSVSADLVHWKHLPLAIPEKDSIMIFSGSAVVDKNNTSGFATIRGQVPMVAIYTAHVTPDSLKKQDSREEQHIAYSLDKGRTWTKYAGNPVLDLHKKDFRDPKVFWYDKGKKWIMVLVLPFEHIVQFYSSKNLKQWEHISDFGPAGDFGDIWECPDLLEVPVENEPGKKKWVLINSQQRPMQYFVGDFDGTKFTNENPPDKIYRPDYGPDYYAGVTYNLLPNQKPVLIAWANNWTYANDIPTFPWRGAMGLPKNLSLKKANAEWLLIQKPVDALKKLRTDPVELKNISVDGKKGLNLKSQQFEMEIVFEPGGNSTAGVHLAVGKQNVFVIGYDASSERLFVDRSGCVNNSFNKEFASLSRYETSLTPVGGKIKLHIFFDNSIIEVFANDGITVMTTQIFPDENDNGIELFSERGTTKFESVKWWKMRSAW
ncbi:MAG TPA: glycoside hydrolase family 32 protein [Chitinophagaceae bacterium]|jgi:fructan beta-fructosidase|nr:glycoside hydrolase family 32 protein [Chitinophagaceae bacterium]